MQKQLAQMSQFQCYPIRYPKTRVVLKRIIFARLAVQIPMEHTRSLMWVRHHDHRQGTTTILVAWIVYGKQNPANPMLVRPIRPSSRPYAASVPRFTHNDGGRCLEYFSTSHGQDGSSSFSGSKDYQTGNLVPTWKGRSRGSNIVGTLSKSVCHPSYSRNKHIVEEIVNRAQSGQYSERSHAPSDGGSSSRPYTRNNYNIGGLVRLWEGKSCESNARGGCSDSSRWSLQKAVRDVCVLIRPWENTIQDSNASGRRDSIR